ncbi:MAG: Asp-tRNA(Asn)/Glu-tRNA(Gln) amidotransferase subunit GatC [Pseudomonadales bacterium]
MSDSINIQHLARLARLSLTEAEHTGARNDLEQIIGMIDAMQSVDTDAVTPMASPLDANQRLRADQVSETVDRERFQAVAPESADGYYLVPRVVE